MSLRDEITAAASAMLAITSPPTDTQSREDGHPVNTDKTPDERKSR